MSKERVIQLLQKKENIQLEFKEAHNKLPSNLFETICAMFNRSNNPNHPWLKLNYQQILKTA